LGRACGAEKSKAICSTERVVFDFVGERDARNPNEGALVCDAAVATRIGRANAKAVGLEINDFDSEFTITYRFNQELIDRTGQKYPKAFADETLTHSTGPGCPSAVW